MSDSSSTSELLSRLVDGDQSTFTDLFSYHRERLKVMLAHRIDRRLLKRADLSDILQEVYIDALNRIHHYLKKPEQSFYVWLRQIAMQRLIEVHRKHLLAEKRSLLAEVSIVGNISNSSASVALAIQLAADQASPSQVVMHEEMVARVEQVLGRMEPLDKEILTLRHFEELKNGEVAEALGISVAAASNRYVRALLRLRAGLVDDSDFSKLS